MSTSDRQLLEPRLLRGMDPTRVAIRLNQRMLSGADPVTRELVVHDVDTGQVWRPTQLTDAEEVSGSAWCPDGRELAYERKAALIFE